MRLLQPCHINLCLLPYSVNHLGYFPAFGSPMPTRTWSDPNSKYKYGFNTQEKDDEIAGEGNINNSMNWEYDTRLGRRWNLDFIFKPSLSYYCTFHNNPIIFIDPNGDDDYYNEFGIYLYTDTKLSNDIRIISQENFDRINLLYYVKLNDKTTTYGDVILLLEENSKVATIDIQGEQLNNLWKESFPAGSLRKEQNAVLVIDLKTDINHPRIIAIKTPDENNTRSQSTFNTQIIKGHDYYQGMVVIGSIHTHPNSENSGHAMTLAENMDGDGSVAITNVKPIFNLYGSPENIPKYISTKKPRIDMFHPTDKSKGIENLCPSNDGKTLGKTALEVNGGTPESDDEKSMHKTKTPFIFNNEQ